MGFRKCGHCGSANIRRAMARTDWHRFVRLVSPLRRYACLDCKRRGWMVGTLAPAPQPAPIVGLAGRPVEERDLEESAESRFRMVVSVLVSLALGALLALWLIRQ